MTAEELLEDILNTFEAKMGAGTFVWKKDNDAHNMGYAIFDTGNGIDIYIVTVQEGKVEPA
jgi:hypothetical protein